MSAGGRISMADRAGDQYNRIFIIGARDCSTKDIKDAFEPFGEITDVYIPRSKLAYDSTRGIAYVTYSKASEAALAIEKMNGKSLKDDTIKHIKVLLANSKHQGSVRIQNEDEIMIRLFIVVPAKSSEQDIRDEFSKFGTVESVRTVKDRKTGGSRGLAYVRFSRPYEAALALENCDPKFKPVFANAPQPPSRGSETDYQSPSSMYARRRSSMDGRRPHAVPEPLRRPTLSASHVMASPGLADIGGPQQSDTVLEVRVSASVSYDHLRRLLDIIPGLDTCQYDHATGQAYVKYQSPQAATYARDKLDLFEYPPGYPLTVRFLSRPVAAPAAMSGDPTLTGVQTLVDSLQKAMSVLQHAGVGVGSSSDVGGRLPPPAVYQGHKRSSYNDFDDRRKLSRFS